MDALSRFVTNFRNWLRRIYWPGLVVVIFIVLGVSLAISQLSTRYPACPEPIGNYTGECSVDDSRGGYSVTTYQNGQSCGTCYFPADGEGFCFGSCL